MSVQDGPAKASTVAAPADASKGNADRAEQSQVDGVVEKEAEDIPGSSANPTDSNVRKPPFKERKRDLLFLPIPKSQRYHPDRPFHFSMALNYLFAFASTFTVANLYYCQPLQVQYSEDFGVSYEAATLIPTLLQGGYAGGLLFITPLGDLVRRRDLTLILIAITTLLSIGLATAKSWPGFQALNFLTGFFTVAPQVLIPLAADLAPVKRRAQCMAIVLSGLLLGILAARVLAGIIAEFASWRDVYYMAIGTQVVIWLSMYFALPDYPAKNPGVNYFSVFWTMGKFLFTNPVLVQGSITSGLGSAIFASFWVTLTFLLSAPPYQYSTLVIGLFGLVGMAGVCTAPFVGRAVDRLVPWVGVVIGNLLLVSSNVLLLGGAKISVGFIVVGILFMDIGQQFQQVSNQSRIFSTNPKAGARLNSVYIISLFIGQLIGSSLSSKVYLQYGARPYYGLNLGMAALNLIVLAIRGPVIDNKKWLGWGKRDQWQLRKPKSPKKEEDQELKSKDVEQGQGIASSAPAQSRPVQ